MAEKKITLRIAGMTCGHCAKTVSSAITELDGVKEADVDPATGMAEVVFDDEKVSEAQIRKAVNETEVYSVPE
ncbi:MAG TPA: cation transporter [Bacteroidia bacterium]|nr:cation transporter [Bacteroidia bacterium]